MGVPINDMRRQFTENFSINLIAIVGRFLPAWFFFPNSTRIEPISVPGLLTVDNHYLENKDP